jgi:hypothetical protein
MLVWATSPVARDKTAHNFHTDFIPLSSFRMQNLVKLAERAESNALTLLLRHLKDILKN